MDIKRWFTARLTARWFRFFAIPVVAGLPGGLAGLWIGIHKGQLTPAYFLQGDEAWVIAAAGAWATGLAILKSYLDEIAKDAIKTLEVAQQDLANLLESVRLVVGSKSKRFFDALRALPNAPNPADTFFTITRPDLQIAQLIGAIRNYFQLKIDPNSSQRVKLSLMKPDGADLVITQWATDADVPSSTNQRFHDNTIAGKAYHTKKLVISENIADDDRYHHFQGTKDQGSMFAYPVVDNLLDRVVYVVNVITSKAGAFKDNSADRAKIETVMEIYAERIVLENRLDEIKKGIQAKQSGGVG